MNSLKFELTPLEINENQNTEFIKHFTKFFDFNETFKTRVILPPETEYRNINFSEITSPFGLIVFSDYTINIKLNGNEITNTKMLVYNSNIESISIANTDIKPATVDIYMWGLQK